MQEQELQLRIYLLHLRLRYLPLLQTIVKYCLSDGSDHIKVCSLAKNGDIPAKAKCVYNRARDSNKCNRNDLELLETYQNLSEWQWDEISTYEFEIHKFSCEKTDCENCNECDNCLRPPSECNRLPQINGTEVELTQLSNNINDMLSTRNDCNDHSSDKLCSTVQEHYMDLIKSTPGAITRFRQSISGEFC